MNKYLYSSILVLCIIYIYNIQYATVNCPQLFADDAIANKMLKTGDMILFKAYNNFNSIFHGGYFGHVGIVYILDDTPYLFEANGVERVPLKSHHSTSGIYLTPLYERIGKYKGKVFLKSLEQPIDSDTEKEFKSFIDYCLENMCYDYSIIKSGVKKALGIEKCNHRTNCGEIVFLSLIKLNLLSLDVYDRSIFHYLRYVCNIEELNNNKYLPLVELIDHPFAN